MNFNTSITMLWISKKTVKEKQLYQPELEAGADDNDSIQSMKMDLKTLILSQHLRKKDKFFEQVNQHQQQSDSQDAMMANLLERMKQMKNENHQKEQKLEIYHHQHSCQHWLFSSFQKDVAEQLARLLSSQMSEDDKEEDWLIKNIRDYWLEIPKLQRRENYWTWWI